MRWIFVTLVSLSTAMLAPLAAGQDHPGMPPGMSHDEHMKLMKKRGDAAMGFDQAKVTHHFYLTRTGGSIEVRANDRVDAESRQQIREHLTAISQEFKNGIFTSPIATHAEVPPGVRIMQ